MLPEQTHQISFVFGLSPALFHHDICSSHVFIDVLSLSSAFEPQQWLWSPVLLLRRVWHGGRRCRPPASIWRTLSLSGSSLWLPPEEPATSYCTGHDAKCHHIAPSYKGGSPEQEQLPLMKGSHRDRCAQTQFITSNFGFFWQSRQRLEGTEAGCSHVCHGRSGVLEGWIYFFSVTQSGESKPDLPNARECLGCKTECLHCGDELLFRRVAKQSACSSAVIKDPKIAFHEIPVMLLNRASWLQSSLVHCRPHL